MTENKGRIATIGMFDGVHRGHRFLLSKLEEEAERRGMEPLTVTFSHHPMRVISPEKEPAPLTHPDEKTALLASSGRMTVVRLDFDESLRQLKAADFMAMLRDRYGVKAILMGYDHHFGHDRLKKIEDYVKAGESIGIEVIAAPPLPGETRISSSYIRRIIAEGKMEEATVALGRPYSLEGIVEKGKQIGRTLGFPTANIRLTHDRRLLPASGVYAVLVTLPQGIMKGGMLNIGTRPTVDCSEKPKTTVEVNIFDFSGLIYGEKITVDFIKRIRQEKKQTNIKELQRQLQKDKVAAEAILSERHLLPNGCQSDCCNRKQQ